MTSRGLHIVSCVPIAFLAVALGYHPVVAAPLVAGALLPEIDAVDERLHRSWIAHSFLIPAVLYGTLSRLNALEPVIETAIHFVALGVALHLFADYIYPKGMSHQGAAWPVRPAIPAPHWGLFWMGLSWAYQWFWYLVPAFFPWVVGR